MFLPTDSSKHRSAMPQNTAIRETDWRTLAAFWHPVAFVHEVGETPSTARLLDVDLVVYRTSAGISGALSGTRKPKFACVS